MPRACLRLLAGLLALLAWAAPGQAQDPQATGSNYGGVGLLETRNARFRPDGTLEAGTSQRNQRQFYFLNFQALPFLETTFRLTDRLNGTTGRGTTNDRAFDMKFRLWEENAWRPALAIGLQDAMGTGIYGGEYIVASKRWGDFDVSLGMGWGRMSTYNDIPNPLGLLNNAFNTRPRNVGQGGTLTWNSWFRGPKADFFGGVEYRVPSLATPWGSLDGLRAKLEFSGDALRDERGGYPQHTTGLRGYAKSRINVGLQWQANDWLDVGASFVNGTDAIVRLSLRMNPDHPPVIFRRPPPPMLPRPVEALPAEDLRPALAEALKAAGFRLVGVELQGGEARIGVEGGRFATLSQTAGRVARAVQPVLPPDIERLLIEWHRVGVPIARLVLLRESMEGAVTGRGSAEEILGSATLMSAGTEAFPDTPWSPDFAWALEPRLAVQLGDPHVGVRWQAGAGAGGRIGLGEGFAVAGGVAQAFAGNLAGGPPSNSVLPHVRSDIARYAKYGKTAIPVLYAERIWSPAPDWFARITGGLLEPMFEGVSAEVLWRPKDRPIALGLDLAWVAQRDYPQKLSTLGYTVTTGQASVYLDLPFYNLYTVLRAGRYLAGDWGGTIEIGRRFESGIEVGGFATFTNVSFAQFGEGSFDKGIYIRIPLQLLGPETASRATALIRPVVRDGGQRLRVDNPLWEVTREGRVDALQRSFTGFLQ